MAFVRRPSLIDDEQVTTGLVAWCRRELVQLTRTVDLLETGHLRTRRLLDGRHIDTTTATADETRQRIDELASALLDTDARARAAVDPSRSLDRSPGHGTGARPHADVGDTG